MSTMERFSSDLRSESTPVAALARVAVAVADGDSLPQLLEVAAEEALAATGAASVSISRWDHDRESVHMLINVQEQGARRTSAVRAQEGEIVVPIPFADDLWGELRAASGGGGGGFGEDDEAVLSAVALHIAAGVAQVETRQRLTAYAYSDHLTGLGNRRAFEERLAGVLAADHLAPVSLVLGDVDGLKGVNDSEGHAAGDRVLRQVADALTTVAAGTADAVAYRIGGDEFCVLLPGCDAAAARRLAAAASALLPAAGRKAASVSWGVAHGLVGRVEAASLLATADAAQYEAKRARAVAPPPARLAADGAAATRLEEALAWLDAHAGQSPTERLEGLGEWLSGLDSSQMWTVVTTEGDPDSAGRPRAGVSVSGSPGGEATLLAWADGHLLQVNVSDTDRAEALRAEIGLLVREAVRGGSRR